VSNRPRYEYGTLRLWAVDHVGGILVANKRPLFLIALYQREFLKSRGRACPELAVPGDTSLISATLDVNASLNS